MLDILTKVMFILLIVLLVMNLFAYVLFNTASEPITFSGLLMKLDQVKPIDISLSDSVQIFQIAADWGAFNVFRDLINTFGSILGLLVWIGSLVINLVYFVGYCLYLLGLQAFSAYV